MPATLRDIARACRLDVSTVSRALRGDPKVKAATRARIREAAVAAGYRPNLAARNLVTGRTRAVWMILGNLVSPSDWEPAYGASRLLQSHGYDLHIVLHHQDDATHERLLGRLEQGVADGAILIPGPPDLASRGLPRLVRVGFPLVFLDRHQPDIPAAAFSTDNRAGARELVRRAAAAGARAAVSLITAENTVEDARRRGVAEGIRAEGLRELAPDEVARLPRETPLAVFATWDGTIHATLRADPAAWAGRRLFFGVFDRWGGEPHPAEAVFVCLQDFPAMAEQAGQFLLALLEGRAKNGRGLRTIPPRGYEEIRARF